MRSLWEASIQRSRAEQKLWHSHRGESELTSTYLPSEGIFIKESTSFGLKPIIYIEH